MSNPRPGDGKVALGSCGCGDRARRYLYLKNRHIPLARVGDPYGPPGTPWRATSSSDLAADIDHPRTVTEHVGHSIQCLALTEGSRVDGDVGAPCHRAVVVVESQQRQTG